MKYRRDAQGLLKELDFDDPDAAFITMAANNIDKLIAVVEHARNFKGLLGDGTRLDKALDALEQE